MPSGSPKSSLATSAKDRSAKRRAQYSGGAKKVCKSKLKSPKKAPPVAARKTDAADASKRERGGADANTTRLLQRLKLNGAELDEHEVKGKTARQDMLEVRESLKVGERFPQSEVNRIHDTYSLIADKVELLTVSEFEEVEMRCFIGIQNILTYEIFQKCVHSFLREGPWGGHPPPDLSID